MITSSTQTYLFNKKKKNLFYAPTFRKIQNPISAHKKISY